MWINCYKSGLKNRRFQINCKTLHNRLQIAKFDFHFSYKNNKNNILITNNMYLRKPELNFQLTNINLKNIYSIKMKSPVIKTQSIK